MLAKTAHTSHPPTFPTASTPHLCTSTLWLWMAPSANCGLQHLCVLVVVVVRLSPRTFCHLSVCVLCAPLALAHTQMRLPGRRIRRNGILHHRHLRRSLRLARHLWVGLLLGLVPERCVCVCVLSWSRLSGTAGTWKSASTCVTCAGALLANKSPSLWSSRRYFCGWRICRSLRRSERTSWPVGVCLRRLRHGQRPHRARILRLDTGSIGSPPLPCSSPRPRPTTAMAPFASRRRTSSRSSSSPRTQSSSPPVSSARSRRWHPWHGR